MKAWEGTGLGDFDSWWPTEKRRGLLYRGDVDMEFMDTRRRITVLEFKQAGENLGRPQLAWLRVRASQPNTEVRVVRELPGEDPEDINRNVVVWNPTQPWADRLIQPLQIFRRWAEARAYNIGETAGD